MFGLGLIASVASLRRIGAVRRGYERSTPIAGKEDLMAGTDCGLGTRVGTPDVCRAKFRAMAEGSRLASEVLWA